MHPSGHRLAPTRFFNTLGDHPPALSTRPGVTVVAETVDANGFGADGARIASGANPMSGPIFMEGAEPGDALGVRIVRITPSRETGWTRGALAGNVVDPEFVRELPPRDRIEWRIDRAAGTAAPIEPPPALAGFSVPLDPMVGCFGVCPAGGEAISTATSGPHGGNMDWRGFRAGCTVWFPVAVPGALFFLGDGHAVQGDGEIVGTGVETSCEMEVVLELRKGWPIGWPRGEDAQGHFTVGNARPLDQALQHATTEMARWLQEAGLDAASTGHLLGQVVRYEIANVFDPAYTVVCRVPRGFWPSEWGRAGG
jgi:acetamidase/formamidase